MFKNMKIGMRLMLGFAVVVLLMVFMGGFAVTRLHKVNGEVSRITDQRWPEAVASNQIAAQINVVARALRNAILLDDAASKQKELKRIVEANGTIEKLLGELEKKINDDEGKPCWPPWPQPAKSITRSRRKYCRI